MITNATKVDIIKILEQSYPEQYRIYKNFEQRGINFTLTQMYSMFLPRQYGKSFMSMCEVMNEGSNLDTFTVSFDKVLRGTSNVLVPTDPDISTNPREDINRKKDYLRDLMRFTEEYYSDYAVINRSTDRLTFKRR